MNSKILFCGLGSVTALAVSLTLWFQLCEVREESARLKATMQTVQARPARPARPPQEQVDLEIVMEKLQRYANKIYFAAKYDNWPLAAFYADELEELVKYVSCNHVMLGPVNISGLMEGILLPPVEKLEDLALMSDVESFFREYQALTVACNQCHEATSHGFVVIEAPRTPALDNQRYRPPELIPTSSAARSSPAP